MLFPLYFKLHEHFCNLSYYIVIIILRPVRQAVSVIIQGWLVVLIDRFDDGARRSRRFKTSFVVHVDRLAAEIALTLEGLHKIGAGFRTTFFDSDLFKRFLQDDL